MAFEFPIRIYWEDTDAGGIVFYANYLKFFERARTEWLRVLGVHQQALREKTGGMFVVSETSARYVQPAVLDDKLIVSAEVSEQSRATLTLVQSAWRVPPSDSLWQGPTEPRTLLAQASIRIAWVDAQTLAPRRIPAEVLAVLTPPGTAP